MVGRRIQFLFAFAVVLSLAVAAPCRADATREQQVKAAFIYNFTQFVEWPNGTFAKSDSPFVVAIVGDDSFGGALDQILNGKTACNRPIVIQHFATVDKIGACQLLFVPTTQDDSLSDILKKIGKAPILTVGEGDSFMSAGGHVHLFLEDGHMKFEISPDALDASKLKASAKLMKLARIYKK